MNFLCPSCRTPLPREATVGLVTCTQCAVQVDLTRVDTAPGQARLWPEVDLKGETLSGHLLVQRLGSGGMGTVYEAESPVGAPVAMKVLSPMLAAEPALRERFRREARAMTQVKHPRVVQLYEEGEDRGFCWYSMELVKGLDLRHRLDKGVMAADEVEALATALLEALGAVHDAGIVHRDLKPANVLLGPEGPRLCDFGIAQVSGATTLTESAALLGSLRYMAPEQRWGKADDRSDLYALGVILHEALAGGVPGEAPLPANVPVHLGRFIERLTRQRPVDRPSSAAEATTLLASLRTARRRQRLIGAGLGAALLLVGGLVVGLGGSSTSTDEPPAPATPTPAAIARPPALDVSVQDAGATDAGSPDAGAVDAGTDLLVATLEPNPLEAPPKKLTTKSLGKIIDDDTAPVKPAPKPTTKKKTAKPVSKAKAFAKPKAPSKKEPP
ncbi:MAG: serine/threonine-protein kinase [Myxococcaceae bacterium]|nr:serine/threonine-protein kinase [Myxococcaceae bacterium]